MNKRTSIIWQLSKEDFSSLIAKSKSYREALKKFDLESKGNNPATLKKRIEEEGVDDSHIRSRKKYDMMHFKSTKPINEILVENSSFSRTRLKKRLIKEKLIEYRCDKCANLGVWQDTPLTLQLDHKNGVYNDNTLANLRFLCPNCHSQTPTFAGKSSCKKVKPSVLNPNWNKADKPKLRKVERPAKEELSILIQTTSFVALGKKYGVSDNAVRKWCQRYGLIL